MTLVRALTPSAPLLHVSHTFAFDLQQSREKVAPLFGAHRERAWTEGWNPQFIHPYPAQDLPGSVFRVQRDDGESTWITTIFKPEQGHIQHVYFIPDVMAVLIDIHLSPGLHSGTHIEVTYERTSLKAGANEHVRYLGKQDAKSAEEWRTAIETYFEKAVAQ
jgi:hypothetical protein